MSKESDLYIRSGLQAIKQLRSYRSIAKRVKNHILKYWSDAEVYVFGSVLEGRYTANSDIDLLIITDELDRDVILKVVAYTHSWI